MNIAVPGVVGGSLTAMAVLAAVVSPVAVASPPEDRQGVARGSVRNDDRPDPLMAKRRAAISKAKELVLAGKAEVESRDGSKSVRLGARNWVEYETEDRDQLLSFLIEFGDDKDLRFPADPAGPLHNQIARPDRTVDNSTYWRKNFTRRHFMKMFFADSGESFRDVYEEMSSGRYTVRGDVSRWVKVPNHEASYGRTENHTDMTRFIDDSAEAWYDAQVARGMSQDEIVAYLERFDRWDRYDYDDDGDFKEPDGYIDHFQAIHAGEGEEAGAPEWAIWSHRWAVNQNGQHPDGVGPEQYGKVGGIEIGNTGLWIRDYTTEPENGGLGVFVHEYGHDLGLPDLYDTSGGDTENGTGFWSLMSAGSWLSHADGTIGTTPNHMGPWEKLQLGWLDHATAYPSTRSTYELGPSFHATRRPQAVVARLPRHKVSTHLGEAAEGSDYFYSGRGDDRVATLTSPAFTVPAGADLEAKVNYEIELDWDYAYAEISTDDGETFTPLETNLSTDTDPNGQNDGNGITGTSDGEWVDLAADLTTYAGQEVRVRFRMYNDASYNEMGLKVDAITVGAALNEGAEGGAQGWTLDGFAIAEDGVVVTGPFEHFYIAESRQYRGYDVTLAQGPYNRGREVTRPNWVEHFPYQNGLLVWYWNTQYDDNDTALHPGGGEVLPVDARPKVLRWSDGTVARNRIQTFDSTFGLERTDAISLHRQVATDDGRKMTRLRVGSRRGVSLFDDTEPRRYYGNANPAGSVMVAGTGTTIEVLESRRNVMWIRVKGALH